MCAQLTKIIDYLMMTVKAVSNFILLSVVALLVKEGLGAAQTDPPSGSVIADFEGTANLTTLVCNVTNPTINNEQDITVWRIANFRGMSGDTGLLTSTAPALFEFGGDPIPATPEFNFNNRLTILQLTSELDEVVIYCGIGGNSQQANFMFRVYRPPILMDNFMVRILENSRNFPIDISQDPTAFPTDTVSFDWTRDGQSLSSGGPDPTLTYSSVTFSTVDRQYSGNYSVFASNVVDGREVGNDTGSFYLDVIYGPTFQMQGPTRRYVRLNDSLSLVCGYDLDSNPDAVITWTAPDGTTVMNNARYDLENGPGVVRLNFTRTILSDNGVWRCNVEVMSRRHVLLGGRLVELESETIGEIINLDIQLAVIATPGPPVTLTIDSTEATSIVICWEAPNDADSPISFYTIYARDVDGDNPVIMRNTSTNATFYNLTGLLPGTTYELTVVAVSQGGDIFAVSQPSTPENGTTGFSAPAPTCTNMESTNGDITVTWSYIHRGGLPLTRVSVVYRFQEGLAMSSPTDVEIANTEVMTATVPDLVAGRLYTFTITAENSNGSASIDCGPVRHDIGVPAAPSFGELMTGSQAGQVDIQIKTVASGVSDPAAQRFEFIIFPVLDGTRGNEMRFPRPNYQSNMFETITIGNLMPGQSYTFSATAVNSFGESKPENSAPVQAAGIRPPTQPPVSPVSAESNIGPAVGGAIGGIAVVALIVLIVIVIILLFARRGRESDYRPKKAEAVRYEKAPTSDNGTKVQEVAVDIGEDMGNKPKDDTEIQYAELDTFRPPSQQKNKSADKEPKPVEIEEPVEYAIITNFKKKEDDPAPVIISAVPDPAPDASEGDADKTGTSTTLV